MTSPAIDKGVANGLAQDQRGAPRTFDASNVANAAGGEGTDIGSVERLPRGAGQLPPPTLILRLTGKRKQQAERLRAKATCSLDCKLTLKAKGKADRRFKSRKTTKRLDAGEKTRVKVRFKRRVLRRIDDEKGRARLIGKATAAGQRDKDRLKVRLKP